MKKFNLKLEISYSVSNLDLYKLFNNKIHIYDYNELSQFNNINQAFHPYDVIFLLFETKQNYGHWTCIINHDDRIEFFDSYGIFPDKERKYTNIEFRKQNNMMLPHLTALLYNSNKQIEYNDHKLQDMSKRNIQTCGRWCAFRYLCKDINIDSFARFFKNNKKYTPDELVTILTSYI